MNNKISESGVKQRKKLLFVTINPNPPGGGQCLGAKEFDTLLVPWLLQHIDKTGLDPFQVQRVSWLMRMCRRIGQNFDVIFSCDNEMDFGQPGIQYIHYPFMHQLKKRVDAVRHSSRTGRVCAFLQGRYRPWMIISGITFEGVESNLMLVNSEWTGRQVQACYDSQPEVLYPPVRWLQTPDSLKQRSLVFVPDSGGQVEIVGNEAALIYSSDDEAVERICDVLQSEAEQTRLGNFLATPSTLFTEHQFMNKLRSIVRDYNTGKS